MKRSSNKEPNFKIKKSLSFDRTLTQDCVTPFFSSQEKNGAEEQAPGEVLGLKYRIMRTHRGGMGL